MSKIGINIAVNSEQVTTAKTRIERLNDSLLQTRDLSQINLGVTGFDFSRLGSQLERMTAELDKMQGADRFEFKMPSESEIQRRAAALRQLNQDAQRFGTGPAVAEKPAERPEKPFPNFTPAERAERPDKFLNQDSQRFGTRQEEKPLDHYDRLIKLPPTAPVPRVEQRAERPDKFLNQDSQRFGTRQEEKPLDHYDRLIKLPPTAPVPRVEQRAERPDKPLPPVTPQQRSKSALEIKGLERNQKSLLDRITGSSVESDRFAMAARLQTVKDFYSKLAAIDRTGSRRGGTITPEQASEASALYSQLTSKAAALRDELKAAGDENGKLARQLQNVHNSAARAKLTIGGYQQQQQQQPGGGAGFSLPSMGLGKLAGWGLAAAGGFSLASFVSNSRSAYQSALETESPLWARGLTGTRGRARTATSLGYGPAAYYQFEHALTTTTGLTEKQMPREAMLSAAFAKFGGLGLGEVAGLRAGLYQSTGSNTAAPDYVLSAMSRAVEQGVNKAKLPELLTLVTRNTSATANAMHGTGLSDRQLRVNTVLATEALKAEGTPYNTYAKSAEFQDFMQNGLRSNGSTAGDITKAQMLGFFDGPMTMGKIHRLKRTEESGFTENPELLQRYITAAKRMAGSNDTDSVAGALGVFDPSIAGKQAEKLVEMSQSGLIDRMVKASKSGKSIAELAKAGDQDAKKWTQEIQKNPALSRESLEAQKTMNLISYGERISKATEKFEHEVTRFGDTLLNQNWQNALKSLDPSSKAILAAAGLLTAASALSFGGGLLNAGKAGAGLLAGAATNPLGWIAAGGLASWLTFKDGGQGANYHPQDRLKAITGKPQQQQTAFAGRLNSDIAKDKRFSDGYKKHAVSIYESAKKWGVPENLLAGLLESESDFQNVPARQIPLKGGKKTTVSGVAQFTDGTAKQYKINPMDTEQSIDGAAHLLSDNFNKTGNWREAVKRYKGVQSPVNEWQVDTAFTKAEKYTKNETERQALQRPANGAADLDMGGILQVLKLIEQSVNATATNTTKTSIMPPLTVTTH